ncbi:MAG: DNA-binding MarR family transcriptional regulator [Desulforhopalus sp.]
MSDNTTNSTFLIKNALLASRLAKRIESRLSVHGISFTEYLIMIYLDHAPKAIPRIELADYVGLSASGVTRLIIPMEKNKLVEKVVNPRDARQSMVALSITGQKVFKEASVSFEHIANELLVNMSQNQLAKAVEIYTKLL